MSDSLRQARFRGAGCPVLLAGSAPGVKEVELRQPFAWTAGKMLLARALALIAAHPAWRAIQGDARA